MTTPPIPFHLQILPLTRLCGLWQETDESRAKSTRTVFDRARGTSAIPPDLNECVRRVLGHPGHLAISCDGQAKVKFQRGHGEPVAMNTVIGSHVVGNEMVVASASSSGLHIHSQNWPPTGGADSTTEFHLTRDNGDELREVTNRTLRASGVEKVSVTRTYRRALSDLERAAAPFLGKWAARVAQHGSLTDAERALLDYLNLPPQVAEKQVAEEVDDIGLRWVLTCGPDELVFVTTNSHGWCTTYPPVCARLVRDSTIAWFEAMSPPAVCILNAETRSMCVISHPSSQIALHDQRELVSPRETRQTRTAHRASPNGAERSAAVVTTLQDVAGEARRFSLFGRPAASETTTGPIAAIFWDLENQCVPRGMDAGLLVSRLKEMSVPQGARLLTFEAHLNAHALPDNVARSLSNAGVKVCHVSSTDKNSADIRIIQATNNFVTDHPRESMTIVLVTSDQNFLPTALALQERRPRVKTVLIHGTQTNPAFIAAFGTTLEFSSIASSVRGMAMSKCAPPSAPAQPAKAPSASTSSAWTSRGCKKKFASIDAKTQHCDSTGHASWDCTSCERSFVSRNALTQHQQALGHA
jgi:hypothetical protein